MKIKNIFIPAAIFSGLLLASGCTEKLNELPENYDYVIETDYTKTSDMINPLIGVYAEFNNTEWEDFPLIAVRGDDVNSGGGRGDIYDQNDYHLTDLFNYNKDYWMYNSLWQNYYQNIIAANSSIEQILKYKEFASDKSVADSYIAEIRVLRAWWLFNLSRVWGDVLLPITSLPSDLFAPDALKTKDEIMQHISDEMTSCIPLLPAVRPNERTERPGGVTKFTALAMKALANLELKNYQEVAAATGEIISSGKFSLESDFYNLFKIKGKLNNENILEMQYSDFGQGAGDNYSYLFGFFGPQGWTPKVSGAGDGWGFFEPSLKYIKFMIDRGEVTRLQTSVLFTDDGIADIKAYGGYTSSTFPAWISNTTLSGDRINNYGRAKFASGKHYLPSDQLTPGRTDYGTNKNFTCIRYAEILLMYAEALTQGASGTAGTADNAVNLVRARAGLNQLSGVTNQQVMDEKFAELAMEWGTRYYDLIRLGKTTELNYDGRTFSADKTFLPYPQNQVDQFPILKEK